MTRYYIYDKTTGEIKRVLTLTISEISDNYDSNSESYITTNEDLDDSTYYVKDGVITEKPDMGLSVSKDEIEANGSDSVTISNIPEGCEVFCPNLPKDQQFFTVNDGEITFSAELKGRYVFRFSLFPYRDSEVVINAN